MAQNSIVIICDDEIISKALRFKLSSLREVDSIQISSFGNAVFEIKNNTPDVLIVFSKMDNVEIFDFVKEIKPIASEYKTPILLVTDNLDEDFIVTGFDVGVDDFVSLQNSDGEILMRTILCMQKNEILRELAAKNKLLTELNVLQEDSGFFLKDYSAKVFSNEIKNIQKYSQPAVLMKISADVKCKNQLTPATLGLVLKKSIRTRDKIGFCGDDKFYLLLPRTNAKGAMLVYERIKQELNIGYSISVGACEVEKYSFEEIDKYVSMSLNEALELTNSIIIYDSKAFDEPMNWLDTNVGAQKNFKFFKAAFLKKLEKVITPVFYQVQQVWEDRLFNTFIEQYTDENQSVFILKSNQKQSVFKITYPGFAKINIDVTHGFVDAQPKERNSMDLNELDDTKLNELLVNFIKEYQAYNK